MSERGTLARFETSSGASIHRIPLEVFPDFWAYVYLVRAEEYCILIDSGSGTETSHADLLSGLQQAGVDPSVLTHILLTHAHIDHYGGLTKLHPWTEAQVGVHELDVQTVAHHEARLALVSRRLDSFLAGTGLAAETCEEILGLYRFTKALYRSVPVDFAYEATGMKLGALELIHLPGHCPGHVAIRLEDVVFCGDMLVEGVTPHLSPESITPYSGLGHYIESLARLQRWTKGARLVLNGHDDVIEDVPAQVEATRHNILRRLSTAVEALGVPLTTEETCRAIYGETRGYNQLLVIEKTGAYMEYLYEHAMIEIANPNELEQALPARYRRLRDSDRIIEDIQRSLEAYSDAHVNV